MIPIVFLSVFKEYLSFQTLYPRQKLRSRRSQSSSAVFLCGTLALTQKTQKLGFTWNDLSREKIGKRTSHFPEAR